MLSSKEAITKLNVLSSYETSKEKREEYKECINTILKDLKVLDIIKENFVWLDNDKLYCGRRFDIEIPIDEDIEEKEEIELLWEWLGEK